MTAFTNYFKSKLLEHSFGGVAFTKPTTLHIGLLNSVTSIPDGNVTEVSRTSTGYLRVAMTCSLETISVPGNWFNNESGVLSNQASIQFPSATGNWGTCSYVGIWDAATAGNLLVCVPLSPARNITTGTSPQLASLALSIALT